MSDETKTTTSAAAPQPMDTEGGLDDGPVADVMITLVAGKSGHEGKVEISKRVACQSVLVKTSLETDAESTEVPLPNMGIDELVEVKEFLEYHIDHPMQEIEKPLKSADLKENFEEKQRWYPEFVENMDQAPLFELILAANYMDIKPLLDLTCAKVASMIKGKTPEQIRQTFNIQDDFTQEEKASMESAE